MNKDYLSKKDFFPSFCIGLLYAIGSHYYYSEGELGHFASVVLILLRLFIATAIAAISLHLLDRLFDSGALFTNRQSGNKFLYTRFCTFMLVWAPLAIIKYPGAVCWDTWRMIHEYRTQKITTHHSVFYTVFLGKLIDITGNPNIGLFLFIILHLVIMAAAFSYALMIISSFEVKPLLTNITMVIWLINPYIAGYVGVAMKDVLYAALMVLLTALLIEIQKDQISFLKKPWRILLLVAVLVVSCLTRKNGLYLSAFILIVVIVKACRNEINRRYPIIIICSIILAVSINYGLTVVFNASSSSVREALSVPFQQTARYVKYHGDDVTAEEKETIDAVLDYDKLASLYYPAKSDYVKDTYKENGDALPSYFRTWLAQFFRHPGCYFSAYCEQYFYIFVPESNVGNIAFYRDVNTGYELTDTIIIKERTQYYEDIFTMPQKLMVYKEWIIRVFRGLYNNYIIGFIANISINVYIIILLITKLLGGKKECILPFTVAIVALAFAMLGPAVYGHPRYLFPIVWSTPLLFFFSASLYKNNDDNYL